jgi:hypothetical protein
MRYIIIYLILLCSVFGAQITSNGTGGGDWNTGSTWVGGSVPGGSDTAVIAATDTVTLNTDLSGTTLAKDGSNNSVTVTGILNCATTATAYLKVSGNIVGTGTINCGSSETPLPSSRVMTFDFNGTAYGFNSANLALNFYCWNPTENQFALTTGAEGSSDAIITVDRDISEWVAFKTASGLATQLHVNDVGGT